MFILDDYHLRFGLPAETGYNPVTQLRLLEGQAVAIQGFTLATFWWQAHIELPYFFAPTFHSQHLVFGNELFILCINHTKQFNEQTSK